MTALRWQQRVWWQSSEIVYWEVRSFSRFASRFLIGRSAQVYFQSLSRPDSNLAWLQIRDQKHSVALGFEWIALHTSLQESQEYGKDSYSKCSSTTIYIYMRTYNDNISSCFDLRRKHRGLNVFQVPVCTGGVYRNVYRGRSYRVKTGTNRISRSRGSAKSSIVFLGQSYTYFLVMDCHFPIKP